MSIGEEKAKRSRPTFSLRMLAIFVALVSLYFATWEATRSSVRHRNSGWHPSAFSPAQGPPEFSPMPFLLVRDTTHWISTAGVTTRVWHTRRCYLWLFGPKIKLPVEWQW